MALRSGSGRGFNRPLTPGAHGSTTGLQPHVGLSRNMGGGFVAAPAHLPVGGNSAHGNDMITKYRPSAAMAGDPLGMAGAAAPAQADANDLPTPASTPPRSLLR